MRGMQHGVFPRYETGKLSALAQDKDSPDHGEMEVIGALIAAEMMN